MPRDYSFILVSTRRLVKHISAKILSRHRVRIDGGIDMLNQPGWAIVTIESAEN
jgi:hypothetical protein